MKKPWWKSLRTKIIAWSFVPTVIILSAVAWFTFYSYQKVLGDLAVKQDWAIAQSKAVEAQTAIANLINKTVRPIILTIDIDYEKPFNIRAQNILDQAQGLDTFDGGIYFLDQHGKVAIARPEQPELLGQDWSDTPQFRYLLNNPPGASPITDIRTIGPNDKLIVCATWPMRNLQGEFIGAAYYCLLTGPTVQGVLSKTLNSLDLGSDVYIIDGNQRIIFSPDPSQIGRDLSEEASIQQLLQGQSKSIRFQKGTGAMVISYYPMNNVVDDRNRWVLIKDQSWSEIMQPTLPYQRLLLALLALGVIVPVLVTAYGVRHITNPIQKLIHASEQVTAGQFKHRIDVRTGDEIETLADQFNLMSAELDELYSSLEKKVAERTHELATLNAIAARVSSSLNLNEIMADALERIMELTGMEHGIAYRIEGGEGEAANTGTEAEEAHLRVMTFRGLPPTFADLGERLPLRQSAAGVAGRRGEPVIWTLVELPTESALRERLATLGVEQVIAIPLMAKGQNGRIAQSQHESEPDLIRRSRWRF